MSNLVKIENAEAIKLYNVLMNLQSSGFEFSGAVWYALSMNEYALDNFNKAFLKARTKLIEKHVQLNEEGNAKLNGPDFLYTSPEDKKKFSADLEKLATKEVEVNLVTVAFSDITESNDKLKGIQGISAFFYHIVDKEAKAKPTEK